MLTVEEKAARWAGPVVAGVAFDDPPIRWVKAGQFVARLRDLTVTEAGSGWRGPCWPGRREG
jgi:hypothetical protein